MSEGAEFAEFGAVESPQGLYRPEIEWDDTLLWHGEPAPDREIAWKAASEMRRRLDPELDLYGNPVLHDGRGLRIPLTTFSAYAYRTEHLTPMHRACQVAAELAADSVPVEASAPCVFSGETILWTGADNRWRTCVNKVYAADEAAKALLCLRPATHTSFQSADMWDSAVDLFDEESRHHRRNRLSLPAVPTKLEAWRRAAALLAEAQTGVRVVPLREALAVDTTGSADSDGDDG